MTDFYITGTRRGLGKLLKEKYGCVDSLEKCDIFINCKHDGFSQVDMLYKAAAMLGPVAGTSELALNKKIINIGSAASYLKPDMSHTKIKYGIEKKALRDANNQLFWNGVDTTCINFGFFDTERVANINEPKMRVEYCVEVIDWVLNQPYRVKELCVQI